MSSTQFAIINKYSFKWLKNQFFVLISILFRNTLEAKKRLMLYISSYESKNQISVELHTCAIALPLIYQKVAQIYVIYSFFQATILLKLQKSTLMKQKVVLILLKIQQICKYRYIKYNNTVTHIHTLALIKKHEI